MVRGSWTALCIHLHKGVSKHTCCLYSLKSTKSRTHVQTVIQKKVRQCTDSYTCTSTSIHTHWLTHRAPGNATSPCSCLVQVTTHGCNLRGKEGNKIRQDGGCLLFPIIIFRVCGTTAYNVYNSPLTSFSPLPQPIFSTSHPHTTTLPFFACKIKATSMHWYIQAACSLIFGYATDSKGLFFLCGNTCCGATWKSPLLHFIHLFAPPHGAQRDFSRDGRQSAVCFISEGERDIEAILQWFPLSFSCFVEQCSLQEMLIICNYKFPMWKEFGFASKLWLEADRARFISRPCDCHFKKICFSFSFQVFNWYF